MAAVDAYVSSSDKTQIMITVRGEIDLAVAEGLRRRLVALAHPATGRIVLDLSRVTFVDCAGLHALIAIDHHVRDRSGTVYVAAASPVVARLFELVGPFAALPFLAPQASGADERKSAGPALPAVFERAARDARPSASSWRPWRRPSRARRPA